MIIDCHGHYMTAPEPHQVFRDAQIKRLDDSSLPDPAYGHISDDQIRESIEQNQLRLQRKRGADLLIKVIPVDNVLFGSEMVGAVRGIDPETGQYFDETKRYIDHLSIDDAAKRQVFDGNARRVYPRLDQQLKARNL